jgi:hypothetical protein
MKFSVSGNFGRGIPQIAACALRAAAFSGGAVVEGIADTGAVGDIAVGGKPRSKPPPLPAFSACVPNSTSKSAGTNPFPTA